jgi:hypothetical protein
MPCFVDWALRRRGPFADLDVPQLKVIAAVNLQTWLVAAVDREWGFRTLRQLGAARFPWKAIMPPSDQAVTRPYGDRILELHGFSVADLKSWGGDDPAPYARTLREDDSAGNLPARWLANHLETPLVRHTQFLSEQRMANGVFFIVNMNSPWTGGLSVLRNLRFLKMDEDALRTVQAEFGAELLTLPERLFAGVDEDLLTIGWRHHYIYGRDDTDPALIRAILASLEAPEFLDNAMGVSYTAVRPGLVPGVELHPVSEAWYARSR